MTTITTDTAEALVIEDTVYLCDCRPCPYLAMVGACRILLARLGEGTR